jgi:hypothetical protein
MGTSAAVAIPTLVATLRALRAYRCLHGVVCFRQDACQLFSWCWTNRSLMSSDDCRQGLPGGLSAFGTGLKNV